jgi:hypothetical protein
MSEMPISQMKQLLSNKHFIQLGSIVSVPWHSQAWQKRHPDIDLKEATDGLTFLLHEDRFAMSEYRQEFPRRFFQLLDIITAADPRLSYHSEDREWLLQSMQSPFALSIQNG